ncbi:dihydroorotate dehydrogenase electron transfer subunit [Chloroflexota bacterium]
MKQVVARVISNEQILPGFVHPRGRTTLNTQIIWLNCQEIAQKAKPGQFVMLRCNAECVLPRPFSIHQVNEHGIALLYNVWKDGTGTIWLSQRNQGDVVELFGPLGNGFSIYHGSQKLLLVAGGMGIAPLFFLSQQALREKCSVTLLLGAQTKSQLYPKELLPPLIKAVTITNDDSNYNKGQVNELLPKYVDGVDLILACGPLAMYKDMAARYPKLKNKPVQVSLEVRMACGRGICYGCTIKTRQGLKKVCQDGPVFELNDILWDEVNL